MRILIAQANARAGGGAEAYATALKNVLIRTGHCVGTVDIHGHQPCNAPPHKLPRSCAGRALWNWAQVCRALPDLSRAYDRVILAYGEGPRLDVPTLTLRHSPTLFSPDPQLLACVGAQPTWPRLAYLKICAMFAGKMAKPGDGVTLANTQWTAHMIAKHTPFYADGILYPHVDRAQKTTASRRPYRVLVLGRIVPNKRIEDAIAVCDKLRASGIPIEVEVLGRADTRYARRLVAQLGRRADLQCTPDADDATRLRALSEARFGLHMFRGEHFGIAVAEMILHGVAPLVFDDGGVCELVTDPNLRFHDTADAANKLTALCMRPDLTDGAITAMQQGQALGDATNFDKNARAILSDWLCDDRWQHAAQ